MKSWFSRWLRVGAVAAGTILFFPLAPSAQIFRLGEWEGAFETVTEVTRLETQTTGSQSSSEQNTLSEQLLTLRNRGAYIYDPNLVKLSVGGTIGLTQNWITTTQRGKESRWGTLNGYDLNADILPENKFALSLFANRSESLISGGVAGTVAATSENRGATFFARRLYVPSSLSFIQEHREEETQSVAIDNRRSDNRKIVSYAGQRGWADSDMSLRYEFIDLTDEILPQNSYRSHEGNLYYGVDFGPELNRHWDSRLRYLTRAGFSELTTLNLDEFVRLDHTDRLRTDYRYSLSRVESSGEVTTTHTGAFNLSHRLYESLTTMLGSDAIFQSLPGGESKGFGGALNLAYTKRIPGDGILNIRLGGGLRYDDNRFRGTESSVLQESHTFGSPFALPIALTNAFVVSGSVVVTKVAFGPLPVGCVAPLGPPTPLVLGQDYTLRTIGDVTEIVPIPCSGFTPGINPGDTIAVDYRFNVSPALSYTTSIAHANISVDYRWIRPYFIYDERNEKLLSGRDGRFLDSQRTGTIGTEFRYDGRRLSATLLAEAVRFRSTRNAYDILRSNQSMRFSILREAMLTLSADEASMSYPRENRQVLTIFGRAALSYSLSANLFADGFIDIRLLRDSEAPTERNLEAGLSVRWNYRSVEVLPSLEFFDRQRGNTDTQQFRAMLRIIRRF